MDRGMEIRHRISIHASLTGGDDLRRRRSVGAGHISIHASLTGGDAALVAEDFCGIISIHASLTGGDLRGLEHGQTERHFNPRLPHGRRLPAIPSQKAGGGISIHASLTGGDDFLGSEGWVDVAISIHASLTGGDQRFGLLLHRLIISIHASLTGGDVDRHLVLLGCDGFQSTPPSREATPSRRHIRTLQTSFQSTPPSREATGRARVHIHVHFNFNPRLPHGRRPLRRFEHAVSP